MSRDKYNTYVEWVGDELILGSSELIPGENPQGTFNALMYEAHTLMDKYGLEAVWSTLELDVVKGARVDESTFAGGHEETYVGRSRIEMAVSVLRTKDREELND